MSVRESQMSEDASVIKKARAVSKGRVTKNINSLNITLTQDEEERFVFDEIDQDMVSLAISHLHSSYDAFQELHEWYLIHALLEDDEDEGDYAKQVADAFAAAKRKYVKYKKAAEAAKIQEQNRAKLTTLHREVSWIRTVLEGKAAAAQVLIDSLDDTQKRSAKFVKAELKYALEGYST